MLLTNTTSSFGLEKMTRPIQTTLGLSFKRKCKRMVMLLLKD